MYIYVYKSMQALTEVGYLSDELYNDMMRNCYNNNNNSFASCHYAIAYHLDSQLP